MPLHNVPKMRIRPKVADADRKRAAKACWRCRGRKSKCIVARVEGGRRACQRCLKQGHRCVFGEVATHDDEDSRSQTQTSSQSRTQNPQPGQSAQQPATPSTGAATISPGVTRSHPSARPHDTSRLLVKSSHQTHYVGEVSNGNFLSKVQDAVVDDYPGEVPNDIPPEHFESHASLDSTGIDAALVRRAIEAFPPKAVSDFLVTTFFRHSEANYYFMDRLRFRATVDHYYSSPWQDVELSSSFVCLVLMVFAMGSQFANLQAPSNAAPVNAAAKYGPVGPGLVFYTRAKSLLSDVITQCSLEGIQACFLMALFLLPSNTSDLSYVYHGMALKMAIAAGLHRKTIGSNLEPRVAQVRDRLWWSLYTSERRLTILLDRPESIKEEDIDAPFPEPCEDLDLPEPHDNTCGLQASITLILIFNRVVRLGKSHDFASEDAHPLLTELKHELKHWLHTLPQQIHLSTLSPTVKIFRGAVHLHMSHSHISVYIGRASLLRLIQARLSLLRTGSPSSSSPPPSATDAALARTCVDAAYHIADLVQLLFANRKLAKFSFTDINYCASAAVIVLIHEIVEAHPRFEETVGELLLAMEFMAQGCQNARQWLKLVRNLHALTKAIRTRWPGAGAGAGDEARERRTDEGDAAVTEYERWERWMAEAENWSRAENAQRVEGSDLPPDPENGYYDGGRNDTMLAGRSADQVLVNTTPAEELVDASYDGVDYQNALQYPAMQGWADDLNLLGLGDFQGLEFPNM